MMHLISPIARLLLLTSVLGATLLPASAAMAITKTVQSGAVRAQLSYQEAESDFPRFTDLHLKIIRNGQTLIDQPVPESEGSWPLVGLDSDWAKEREKSSFQVQDLDADGEPEVLADFFTGGAHCCTYSLIYRYNPTQKTYSVLNQFWGNGGYQMKNLDKDRVPEFHSRDDRFAYAFGSYAGSGYPLQIWQYRQGKMVDVTRQYPQLIYNDAYQWWQIYTENREQDTIEFGKGPLAAYLADKYLLGQGQDGWRRVRQAYQGSDRQKFFTELRQFLQENGYASPNSR